MTSFEPEMIVKEGRVIYRFQTHGLIGDDFLYWLLGKAETRRPELVKYDQWLAEHAFRRALIHPERYRNHGGKYQVT